MKSGVNFERDIDLLITPQNGFPVSGQKVKWGFELESVGIGSQWRIVNYYRPYTTDIFLGKKLCDAGHYPERIRPSHLTDALWANQEEFPLAVKIHYISYLVRSAASPNTIHWPFLKRMANAPDSWSDYLKNAHPPAWEMTIAEPVDTLAVILQEAYTAAQKLQTMGFHFWLSFPRVFSATLGGQKVLSQYLLQAGEQAYWTALAATDIEKPANVQYNVYARAFGPAYTKLVSPEVIARLYNGISEDVKANAIVGLRIRLDDTKESPDFIDGNRMAIEYRYVYSTLHAYRLLLSGLRVAINPENPIGIGSKTTAPYQFQDIDEATRLSSQTVELAPSDLVSFLSRLAARINFSSPWKTMQMTDGEQVKLRLLLPFVPWEKRSHLIRLSNKIIEERKKYTEALTNLMKTYSDIEKYPEPLDKVAYNFAVPLILWAKNTNIAEYY